MKIAYITTYNSYDVQHWSGTGYYIADSLKRNGVDLIRINCFKDFPFWLRLRKKLTKWFFKKLFQIEREPFYLKRIARIANKQLDGLEYDIIFSPSSLPIAYIKDHKPIVFFTDATYDSLLNLYLQGKAISEHSIKEGNNAEAKALQKAKMVFYTSSWAAESAITKYGIDAKKIIKSNIGANIEAKKSESEVIQLIHARLRNTIKDILFIGVDWERKGAKKAIETVLQLRALGYEVTLTLVGCTIPKEEKLPEFVTYYPFISKSNHEGRALLNRLFEKAYLFILPTLADCTPVVFAEAAAYGIPVITTDTGGCASVIVNNITGFCLQVSNFEYRAVQTISKLIEDEKLYKKISLGAFNHFCSDLNWDIIGKKLVNAMLPLLKEN